MAEKKKSTNPDKKQSDATQKLAFKMISTKKGYLRPEHSCRCSNCQERISIPLKASEATCPYCKMPFQISWVTPQQPRIMAPIWSAVPGPGPWPAGTPGYIELDDEGNPVRNW